MAFFKGNMRRGPSGIASEGHRSKVCITCGKEFSADKEEADAKVRFSKKETNRFINEEGEFSCGTHRRDEVCNDCFQTAVANDKEALRRRRILDRAVKGIWRKIYLKEGDKVPWSEDEEDEDEEDEDEDEREDEGEDEDEGEGEDEDDEVPLENDQRQAERASPRLSQEKTCAHCGKVGNLDRCAKCKVTFYCSRSHQAADYAKHKAHCQAPKSPVNDKEQPRNTRVGDEAYQASRATDRNEGSSAGSNENVQPPSATWLICAYCGIKTDRLSRCARCKCTWYCSADHQRAHYPDHKLECRLSGLTHEIASQPPAVQTDLFHPHIIANKAVCLKNRDKMPRESPVISWRELEAMHPNVALGRTLEVRIVSEPSGFLAPRCEGRDAEGVERKVALITYRPPAGLRQGCVLRWRNPWFHRFAHGGSGANIEHWDLPNVTVSPA